MSLSVTTKNPGVRKSVDFDGFSKKTELIAIYVREGFKEEINASFLAWFQISIPILCICV